MNRLDLLEEFYNQITHNISCYSSDLLMNKAKIGYEEKWKNENEKLSILDEMIKEAFAREVELEILNEKKEGIKEMSFSQEKILRMYSDIKFHIRNSNGGLLGGTYKLEDAIQFAKKCKERYLKDPLNNKMEVFVLDVNGKEIYRTDNLQNSNEDEEYEEME